MPDTTPEPRCTCSGNRAGLNPCATCPAPWPELPGASRITTPEEVAAGLAPVWAASAIPVDEPANPPCAPIAGLRMDPDDVVDPAPAGPDPAAWPKPFWPPNFHPTSEPYAYQPVATGYASSTSGPSLTRVEIDLNVRARGTQARVGFEDADGPLQPGQTVEVYESETGLTGTGTVTAINTSTRLAWIAVEWPKLRTSDRTETGVTIATAQAGGGVAEDSPADTTGAQIAYRIRAELVCCHIYDRVNGTRELTFRQAMDSRDWHDLCYWGEAAAGIAEQHQPDPGRSEPDNPDWAALDQVGHDTPGCDCDHDGMGAGWHASDCAWKSGMVAPCSGEEGFCGIHGFHRQAPADPDHDEGSGKLEREAQGSSKPGGDLNHAPSAFTWAETVASYGTGPTAVIDIDVHAPGHDEPVPVEIPLAEARVLHAMLSGILAEHDGAGDPTLREAIARALRDAAFFCDGECGDDEAACDAAHPIQEAATTHGVISDLYGPVDDIAGVVAGVCDRGTEELRGELAELRSGVDEMTTLAAEEFVAQRTRADTAEAEAKRLTEELAELRATLDHMSKAMSWISGHDRQGLDHLEEAQYEAGARLAAVKQAQRWAGRARAAEATVRDYEHRLSWETNCGDPPGWAPKPDRATRRAIAKAARRTIDNPNQEQS